MEANFYNNPKKTAAWYNAALCSLCAGSSGHPGVLDEQLVRRFRTVLPVCEKCASEDGQHPVRYEKKTAAARQAAAAKDAARAAHRQQREAPAATATPSSTATASTSTSNGPARGRGRGRGRHAGSRGGRRGRRQ